MKTLRWYWVAMLLAFKRKIAQNANSSTNSLIVWHNKKATTTQHNPTNMHSNTLDEMWLTFWTSNSHSKAENADAKLSRCFPIIPGTSALPKFENYTSTSWIHEHAWKNTLKPNPINTSHVSQLPWCFCSSALLLLSFAFAAKSTLAFGMPRCRQHLLAPPGRLLKKVNHPKYS